MHTFAKSATRVAMATLLGACSSMLPFTKIDVTDPAAMSKLNGSRSVSGFDGCNDFKGSYAFDGGLMKANVASTRRAGTSDIGTH